MRDKEIEPPAKGETVHKRHATPLLLRPDPVTGLTPDEAQRERNRLVSERMDRIMSGGTTPPFCSFCGETEITFPHTCMSAPKPKRFDPYEALDLIDQVVVNGKARLSHSDRERLVTLDELSTIHAQVNLLRAYITGMER